MATLVLSTVGSALGGPLGGALGSLVGQSIDQSLFGPGIRKGPRLGDLSVQTSSYGSPIPRIYGTMRVAGTVIWSTDIQENESVEGGGKGSPEYVAYRYSASFAVALSSRPIREVRRIWADGKLIRGAAGDFKVKTRFRVASGDEDQPVDPGVCREVPPGAGSDLEDRAAGTRQQRGATRGHPPELAEREEAVVEVGGDHPPPGLGVRSGRAQARRGLMSGGGRESNSPGPDTGPHRF